MAHFTKYLFLQLGHCSFVQRFFFLFSPFSEPKAFHHCRIWLIVEQNHQNFLVAEGAFYELKPHPLNDVIQDRVIEVTDLLIVHSFDGCDGSFDTVAKVR